MAIEFPEPVISVAVAPKTEADAKKMAGALSRLTMDDPSFRVRIDPESGKTIISGQSELHLQILLERLKREFVVASEAGKPRIAYRETVRKKVVEEAKYIRQSGGRGHYAHCVLQIEPLSIGQGFEFTGDGKGRVPSEYVPAVEKGVREALEGGALAGYPIVDVKVTLLDGSYHDIDSNEMAFKIAGAMAFRAGCGKAEPVILEPIMKVEAAAPERFIGDIVGDLNSRRARIQEMGDRENHKFVRATVPLSEMFGYPAVVRSISQGRASFQMEFSHFEEIPWEKYRASVDPHGGDDPPSTSAGRSVRPIRPRPGVSGGESRKSPPESE